MISAQRSTHASGRSAISALLASALAGGLLFGLLAGPAPAAAQRWPLPAPVRARVDSVFAFVGRDEPGCALGVIQDGRMAYARGYGLANLDWGIPIGASTVFDIGSVSKQFTATAVALLELDGVLTLDDDARRWIPEMPDYGTTLTLRHLLNHTSGVRDYLTLMSLAGFEFANVFDEAAGVALIARQRALNFDPGAEHLYSNSGYLLLAAVVRRASGQSLRDFLQARVFDPLGMAHTSVWDRNTEIVTGRATGYSPSGRGWEMDHAWNFQMGGDGQVLTSVEDLARWDANFYDPRVGGQALLERLHTRGILSNGDTIAYALGLTLDRYRGLRRVQHGGAWAGFRAMLARFPDQRTSVVVECNRGDANPAVYANAVADAVLEGAFPPAEAAAGGAPGAARPPVLSAARLERWAGMYRHATRPEYVTLEARDGTLWVVGGAGTRLVPLSPASFQGPGAVLEFSASEGTVRFTRSGSAFERVAPASPDAAALTGLAGSYASDELGAVFEIRASGDTLALRRPGAEPVTLRPGRADEFLAPGATLTFEREGGRVIGFRVFAGRVTGIVFAREGQGGDRR
ncbi:MAG: beta-lactamase family protein [Gemmatimonadetes bacterium]|nr:beta-lactamase family protein [Gemmatimonadota bacterium]